MSILTSQQLVAMYSFKMMSDDDDGFKCWVTCITGQPFEPKQNHLNRTKSCWIFIVGFLQCIYFFDVS